MRPRGGVTTEVGTILVRCAWGRGLHSEAYPKKLLVKKKIMVASKARKLVRTGELGGELLESEGVEVSLHWRHRGGLLVTVWKQV